jgi:putative endopeptidase
MPKNYTPGLLLFIILVTACHPAVKEIPPADILEADLDTTISPASDFFAYANNGWAKKTPIPPEESSWGVGNLVQKDIYERLRKISEAAAEKPAPKGSVSQQIGDCWISGMDSANIEKEGLAPLRQELGSIDAIHNIKDLLRVAAFLHKKGIGVLFNDGISQDDKNSDQMIYQLQQGGLGMPNRDYYFNSDEKATRVRNAYKDYLFKTFRRLDKDSLAALAAANSVFQLETRLAKASRKLADLRDPNKKRSGNYSFASILTRRQSGVTVIWSRRSATPTRIGSNN